MPGMASSMMGPFCVCRVWRDNCIMRMIIRMMEEREVERRKTERGRKERGS